MGIKSIIEGLKFTVEMFLYDPGTGEQYTEPQNAFDKITIDACKGAIEILEQNDHKKIETITSILKSAKADPTRDEYAEYYLDKIEEVIRWTPT